MLEIDVEDQGTVVVHLHHNSFVSKWLKLFEHTLATCSINQDEAFACNLDEHVVRQRLLDAITTINNFLKHSFIEIPLIIDWEDQEWYNYLHIKFEKLNGTHSSYSRLFALAPQKVREAIRAINFWVHRLEIRPYRGRVPWYISFDKNCYTRKTFEPEDYDLFQHEMQSGTVFLHYAEVGKTYYDIWKDNLPLDYAGMKNSHHYSAEFSVYLGPDKEVYEPGFYTWAKEQGIDIHNKKLGLGIVPLGYVDVDHARKIVYNGTKISYIRIKHGQTI